MASKALFLLLALLAFVLLLSSEVSARDLAKASKSESANELENAKYGGYPGGGGGYPGRGGYGDGPGGYPGHGGYGDGPGRGGGGGYGGGCRYGCCGHGNYGRGCRCCASAAEASQAATSNKPQN